MQKEQLTQREGDKMLLPGNKKFGMVLLRVNNEAEEVRRDPTIKGSVNYVKDFEIYDDSNK